ncbi:hypothetical protein EGT74_16700 [Chitinophaga lutea]|uniref:Uncharacterized protein n=1 Tax=Chitinophaga lutea TaxID=2488634 RepID=A0A3N4PKE0_9BACT|nr:hypothetical protein [Chitinophaga lutea]RPE08676.1 hypothetical protein EGT74_16700 [Chitinophaga lutea]
MFKQKCILSLNSFIVKNALFALLLVYSLNGYSQERHQAVKSSTSGGRYEIVQSEISSIYTFRLDKYVGKVEIIVTLPNEPKTVFVEIPVNHSEENNTVPDKINYQLWLGGGTLSDCYLLNIHTGTTWELVQKSNRKFSFEVIE